MTPDQIAYLQWRVSVLRDRLTQRLASEHAIVREHAREHHQWAAMMLSLTTTPASAYTVTQKVWHAWLVEAEQLYRDYYNVNDYSLYLRLAMDNSAKRDKALAMEAERAA